jgi:hypothetical protein
MPDVRSIGILAVIFALGCQSSETADAPARDTSRDGMATVLPPLWYERARALDLTGDGRPDRVRLTAAGTNPDSLNVTLFLIIDGEEKHRERWGSSYELALVDSVARLRPRVDTVLRAQLDSVLASVVVERLDAHGVRLMAEDSVALAGLDPRPSHRVSFSYGYESTVRLAWDPRRKRFVRLWSCC